MIRSLVVLALLWSPVTALAQVPRSVSLDVARCESGSFDALAVIDAARVELAADGIPEVHAAIAEDDGAIARVHIEPDCDDATTYVLRVDDLVTRKSVTRTLTLDGIPASAAPRALAIAAAELLRASWAELELVDVPSAEAEVVDALRVRVRGLREARRLTPPEAPVPVVRPPEPRPAPVERVTMGVAGVVRAFPGGGVAPAGGRVVLDLPVAAGVRLALDAEAVFGSAYHPLGSIDLGLASGGIALRYDASLDVLRVGLGLRVAGGGAWTAGHPSTSGAVGASGSGFVLIVGGVLVVDVPLGDVVSARLDVEGGGAPVGFLAYVDTAPVAGFVGGYLAASLGLALRF